MEGKKVSWLVLGLSILCVGTLAEDPLYNHLWLVERWPPSVCSASGPCRSPVPNRFTIHGLWPKLNAGANLEFCSNITFNKAAIRNIRNRLVTQWPSLSRREDHEDLWAAQWAKHGTCFTETDQLAYFQTALQAKQMVDIMSILQRAGLTPGTSKIHHFDITQISSAISPHIGNHSLGFRCVGQGRLAEIVLCYLYDGQNLTFTNCPRSASNCPPRIVWLPRHSSALALPADESEFESE